MNSDDEYARLLSDINKDVPEGLDWRAGALAYVQAEIKKAPGDWFVEYLLLKPTSKIPPTASEATLTENVGYLNNFVNCLELIALPGESRILDVACGSGWLGHYFARMGYDVAGFDIAPDMVEITKRRFREDKMLSSLAPTLNDRFFTLDIERDPLPNSLHGSFDAIILESCAHHFFDPLTAFKNLAVGLRENGVMVIIEGERRFGPVKAEYISVMLEFATLERPYTREQFENILSYAGLGAHQFLGRLPRGWFAPDDPIVNELPEFVLSYEQHLNYVVAAKNEIALQRVFPHRRAEKRAEVRARIREREVLLQEKASLLQERAQLNQQNQNLNTQLYAARVKEDELSNRISAIQSSTSWRITSPVRRLAALFGK